MLAAQLAHLPHLRELFLVKGYAVDPGHRGQFGHPGALGRPEAAGTFERMLHSLRQLQGLHTLQVAAINDSVSLSRCAPRTGRLSWRVQGPYAHLDVSVYGLQTAKTSRQAQSRAMSVCLRYLAYLCFDGSSWRAVSVGAVSEKL